MGKALSLRDFFPIGTGQVAEAAVEYGTDWGEEMEGAPVEMYSYRGVAESFETGCARLLAAVEAEVPQGGPENLDELIDGLYEVERIGQALFMPLIRQADGALWAEPLVRSLESLRDSRWNLMMLRADLDQDEDGPEFSNPEDLRRFIDGLH